MHLLPARGILKKVPEKINISPLSDSYAQYKPGLVLKEYLGIQPICKSCLAVG